MDIAELERCKITLVGLGMRTEEKSHTTDEKGMFYTTRQCE